MIPSPTVKVSIHAPAPASVCVIPELLCVTGFGRGSGVGADGWYPGVPGERVADGGEDLVPVLGGGGCVAADRVPVPGGGQRAEPAADLLLGFRGPRVAFGLIWIST
jgi:hypothetical protein